MEYGNLIDRQALCEYALNQKDKCVTPNDIMRFPSAEPERKNGKWINARDGHDGHVKCGVCFKTYDWDSEAQYFNFCPNCGASML